MSVIAINGDGIVRCQAVDQIAGWQRDLPPFCFIPGPAGDPLFGRTARCFGRYSPRHLLAGAGIVQLHIVQIGAALGKMHMRVVESRQQPFAGRIDHARLGAAPGVRLLIGANRDDPAPENHHCLGFGSRCINRPDLRVADNQVGASPRPRQARCQTRGATRQSKKHLLYSGRQTARAGAARPQNVTRTLAPITRGSRRHPKLTPALRIFGR